MDITIVVTLAVVAKDYMSRAFYVAEREAGVLSRVMEKLEPVLKKYM